MSHPILSGVASGVPTVPLPKTTGVLVLETPRQGVTAQQIMAVLPAEIRATARLYLDGKIRQWYSRGDERGVILLVDATTLDDTHNCDFKKRAASPSSSRANGVPPGSPLARIPSTLREGSSLSKKDLVWNDK